MTYHLLLIRELNEVHPAMVNGEMMKKLKMDPCKKVLAEKEIDEKRYMDTVKELTHPEEVKN